MSVRRSLLDIRDNSITRTCSRLGPPIPVIPNRLYIGFDEAVEDEMGEDDPYINGRELPDE